MNNAALTHEQPGASSRGASSTRPWGSYAGFSVFLMIAILWSSAPFLTPHRLSGESFLFHDNSYALFTADRLLDGKLLFRDVFYQYGPLTAYLHAGWARLFGNTPLSYWHLAQLLTCLNAIQLWLLLRRNVSVLKALAFGVLVLFPYFLIPGGGPTGLLASVYVGLERAFLLAITSTWMPAADRTHRSAVLIGLLLGCMQGVKFGGAFVAGGALLGVDLLFLCAASSRRDQWRQWLKISLATLLGFLVMEAFWVSLAFTFLPRQLAIEVLWPSWMVENYQAYRDRSVPYAHWFSLRYFVGVQLPLAAAFVANVWLVCKCLATGRTATVLAQISFFRLGGPPVFFAIFFPLALAIYLPHMWVAAPYAWMFLFPVGFALRFVPPLVSMGFYAACLPAFLLTVKGVISPPQSNSLREWRAANSSLWLPPETVSLLVNLQQTLEKLRDEAPGAVPREPVILGYPMSSGFQHFLGYGVATRHAWFMPGFVRPREEPALLKSLDRTLAVVVYFPEPPPYPPTTHPRTWEPILIPVFTEATCLVFAERLLPP